MNGKGEEEGKRLKERQTAYKQWLEENIVSSVEVGQKLDVRDTEYIWCKATVELKIATENR